MDHDDIDALNNHLLLAGEGRSKSSALRPYAFPRFDYDDSLPGNLRFDSLVQTDIFLGIRGREDSQCIENCTRRNNLIEFCSSANDLCSINRRHNVWSEATSLESFEMLLKSVGQEQHILHSDSFFYNSNTFNELDRLVKQMGTNHDKDDINGACSRTSENTQLSNVLVSNFLTVEDHLEGHVMQTHQNSMPHVSFASAHEDPCHLGSSVQGDRYVTPVAEENLRVGSACGERVRKEAECPIDESLNPQKLESSSGIVSTSEHPKEIKDHNEEGTGGRQGSTECVKDQHMISEARGNTLVVEDTAVADAFNTAGSSIGHASSLDKGHGDKIVPNLCVEAGGSECHSIVEQESCIVLSQPESGEANYLSTSAVFIDGNTDNDLATRGVKLAVYDIPPPNKGFCLISESKRDSVERLDHEFGDVNLGKCSQKKDSEVTSTSEPSPGGNKSVERSLRNADHVSNVHMGNSSLIASEEQIKGKDGAERAKELSGDFHLNAKELQFKCASSFVPVFNEDHVSVTREDCIRLSAGTSNMTNAVAEKSDRGIGSSVLGGCSTVDEKRPHQAQPETAAETESEINSVTNEKRNDVGDANRAYMYADASMVESGCVGLEDVASQMSMNAVGTQLSESKDVHHAAGIQLSESEGVHHACGTQLYESKDRSASAMKEIESQLAVSRISGDHADGFGSLPDQHEEIQNRTERGSAGCSLKQRDILTVDQDERKQPLAAASLEAACGSPTMMSSDNPSRDKEGKQAEARGSVVSDEFAKTEQCASPYSTVQDTSDNENSFTFKVSALPEVVQRERGNTWTPFSIAETFKAPSVVEQKAMRVPYTSSVDKIDVRLTQETSSSIPIPAISEEKIQARLALETSGQSPKVSDVEWKGETLKSTSGHKGRMPGKGAAKESSSKVNSQKGTSPKKSSRKTEKSPNVPLNQVRSSLTAFDIPGSAKPPVLQQTMEQPFSDSQQVQLRAQIFVYGSLIQGVIPDEASMDSAFGPSNGGRSMWESVWRAAAERIRKQKFHSSVQTPAHSAAVPEIAAKPGSQRNKVLSSPASRVGSKGGPVPPASPNPRVPLSPLWSISTSCRDGTASRGISRSAVVEYQPAISPLHPFQTPPILSFIGHSSWPSQPPFPRPLTAQSSLLSPSIHFSTIPVTESVKSNRVKDSALSLTSVEKNLSTNLIVPAGDPRSGFAGLSSAFPEQTLAVSSSQLPSTDSKPTRRKKSQSSIDVGKSPLISLSQAIQLSSPQLAIPTSPVVAVTVSASAIPISASTVSPVCAVLDVSSFPRPKIGNLDNQKDGMRMEDTLRKVSEAKLQAEEAACLAASAVNHSQSVWNELSKQKESGAISEAEGKISSAAVAVPAAASVAKVAAAAARLATNAALQAKLMADEALLLCGSGKLPQSELFSSPSLRQKDGGSSHPGSILTAAREAAKRRIEAATAAAKQAENLEAIVRAAELASEAVTRAGNIVAMGKSFLSKDSFNFGPDGYWSLTPASPNSAVKSGSKLNEQIFVSAKETRVGVKDGSVHVQSSSQDMLTDLLHVHLVADGFSQSITSAKTGQDIIKRHNVKSTGVLAVPESSSGSVIIEKECEELNLLHGYGINKGSLVEVYKHDNGLKPAWFSAIALALEDGKVLVSYSGLHSDGPDNIKEWVSLEGKKGEAPRIRVAPGVVSHPQGTRKRGHVGDYTWCVGDRADVQFEDCWWEGVVIDMDDKDATTLTVHFPARGQTSVVRSWQLRPSHSWVDGKWVELPRSSLHLSLEENIPLKKRQKFGSPSAVSKGKDKSPETPGNLVGQPEEPKPLALGATDEVFNIDKSSRAGNKPDAPRTLRSGRQKEGSKVVFGVPKPGKKRKFMEVSKNYPAGSNMAADINQKHEASDPVKFAKSLMPRVAPCEPKNITKVELKEKRTIPSVVSTTRKLSTATYKSMAPRERTFKSDSATHDENFTERRGDIDYSKLQSEEPSSTSHLSSDDEEAEEGPLSSLFHGKLEKLSYLSSKSKRLNQGKMGPAVGNLSKIEEDEENGETGEAAGEASEPRRSNRRIQPTHRLLEGIQSSLIIPKMSSVSYDKGQRSKAEAQETGEECS